ncbi:MAG: NAD(P)/FAD-dependent oxidoreductase [Pyrinomonadaceae bacterium]
MKYDVAIIGGGAAGLLCAIEAGKRGRKTVVIEHNAEVGRKILISGGGRCNFTNIHTRPENFISQNPHFCKSALARYTPQDFVSLVKKHNIRFYEKKLGQLFCRESARLIVEMLLEEASNAGVEVSTSTFVSSIQRGEGFRVETNRGEVICEKLVIACGGLSFPKIGASDLGYRVARQFGLEVVGTRPSLVALVFANGLRMKELAGISIDSAVSSGERAFRENILFTHRGLSGPAILQISNYWENGRCVEIDLLPDIDFSAMLNAERGSRRQLDNFLGRFLPNRFIEDFIPKTLGSKPIDQISNKEIAIVVDLLHRWTVSFDDTEGYGRAEVTIGGVSTNELSSQTMESRKSPGLYFIGEIVDVTGWLGGYNFQWAWASGFAAGNAV